MRLIAATVMMAIVASGGLGAQRGAEAEKPPPTPQVASPIDLTGSWVSVVSEDWRWRMVTPPKGDYNSIPINAAAKKVADTWDPAKDEAAGDRCKSYAAPALMRIPGRLRITWQDPSTLKVETDAGTQTRLFHFGEWKSPGGRPTYQGESRAEWEIPQGPGGSFGPGVNDAEGGGSGSARRFGSLKVVTTRLQPGYLRKNGVPYSAGTTLTEHWDLLRPRNGDVWLIITTVVSDPTHLQRDWITSLNFKKEPDGSKWDPTACSTTW